MPPRRSRSLGSRQSPSRRTEAERRDVTEQISFIDNDDSQQRPRSPRRRQSPVARSAFRRRSSRSPSPVHPAVPPRKRFGLTAPAEERKYIGKFDFEDKYPEDPIYEELGPNARVWRANMDECEVYDNDMVNEARDGLDLLLVFAGLFSAVLTTFVAQTSQALSNNFPAVSTSLLVEMVTLQRALINGTSIDNVPSTELTSGPSGFDVWVNALWFTSLTLSLGTALMAVLVKQWLHQYMSATSGTPRDRSLIRHYRFEGLRKWRVLTIIGILPVVLHVALGVFLAGLVVLLIPLNIPLACVIGAITIVIYVLYAVSNILPILYVQCPYRTPFSDTLNALMRPILGFIMTSSLLKNLFRPIQFLFGSTGAVLTAIVDHTRSLRLSLATALASAVTSIRKAFPTFTSTYARRTVFTTLKDAERITATGDDVAEDIACDALLWLYHVTSNPPTKSVILQSVGCLSGKHKVLNKLTPLASDIEQATPKSHGQACDILSEQVNRTERLLRAYRRTYCYNPETEGQMWCFGREWAHPPFRPVKSATVRYSRRDQAILTDRHQWSETDLLVTVLKRHATDPVLFPPALWQHLFDRCLQSSSLKSMLEDIDLALKLCGLALENFRIGELAAAPFSAGVDITHGTVRLFKFVVTLLFQLPSEYDILSEPLRGLLRINDLLLSILSSGHDDTTRAVYNITFVWCGICTLRPTGLPPEDYQALCRKAEITVLRISPDGWLDAPEATKAVTMNCCRLICAIYQRLIAIHKIISSNEFLFLLLSHLCLSLKTPSFHGGTISSILCGMFDRDVEYLYLTFCLHSLFSTPTVPRIILDNQFAAYSVIIAFASGLARGTLPPRVTLHCMDYLFAEPDRLFTVCRVLALGERFYTVNTFETPFHEKTLVGLASIVPTHPIWLDRAYQMRMDLRDWPCLRPSDASLQKDDAVQALYDRMESALNALDGFFASLDQNYPEQAECVPERAERLRITDIEPHVPQVVSTPSTLSEVAYASERPDEHQSRSNPLEHHVQPAIASTTVPPLLTRLRGAVSRIASPHSSHPDQAVRGVV